MKKIFALTVFLFVLLVPDTFGQTGLLNVNRYASYFLDTTGNVTRIDRKYTRAISDEDYDKIALLGGDNTRIDTSLEITLMSISPAVVQIRPAEANAMLPANNPKQADLILGAAVFQEMQVLRFLGDTAAVSRYEAMLRFITGRNNATRTEVETYFRNGIRSLVSEIVSEEFNKISFMITNSHSDHGATLTRNAQTGQYTLSYGGAYTNNETRTITGNSLNTLLNEMRRNTTDFDQTGINNVRTQAALMPAVAYPVSVLDGAVNVITAFYLNPSQSTFNALGVQHRTLQFNDGDKGRAAARQFYMAVSALNEELGVRILR